MESLPPIEPTSVSICAMSCAEHRGNRLAPTRGLFAKALEVFLERIVGILALEARSHQLRERFDDREVGAIELVRLRKIRVEAPGHARACGGLAVDRELRCHGHGRRELVLAAEGHEHRGRADGRVKALDQALVGGHVQGR